MSEVRPSRRALRSPIERNALIVAPADELWPVIRRFGGVNEWHPLIVACELLPGPPESAVGCTRRVTTTDGIILQERLVALSDLERSLTYQLLDFPMPVADFLVTIKVQELSEPAGALAVFRATFRAAPDDEIMIARANSDAFGVVLTSLRDRFGRHRSIYLPN